MLQSRRDSWEDPRRAIHGAINRLDPQTLKPLARKLFESNLLRGRGLLSKSLLRAAVASPTRAATYASLAAVINAKLPEIGELCVQRAVSGFRKFYKRRDGASVGACVGVLAHFFNQGMVHELLVLQLLTVLLDGDPNNNGVGMAIRVTKIAERCLEEASPRGVDVVMERTRGLLHEGGVG